MNMELPDYTQEQPYEGEEDKMKKGLVILVVVLLVVSLVQSLELIKIKGQLANTTMRYQVLKVESQQSVHALMFPDTQP